MALITDGSSGIGEAPSPQHQPIGRLGRPEELADRAVYLASDESGFINGAALPIDGSVDRRVSLIRPFSRGSS
jgi:hypothetical protein